MADGHGACMALIAWRTLVVAIADRGLLSSSSTSMVSICNSGFKLYMCEDDYGVRGRNIYGFKRQQ